MMRILSYLESSLRLNHAFSEMQFLRLDHAGYVLAHRPSRCLFKTASMQRLSFPWLIRDLYSD